MVRGLIAVSGLVCAGALTGCKSAPVQNSFPVPVANTAEAWAGYSGCSILLPKAGNNRASAGIYCVEIINGQLYLDTYVVEDDAHSFEERINNCWRRWMFNAACEPRKDVILIDGQGRNIPAPPSRTHNGLWPPSQELEFHTDLGGLQMNGVSSWIMPMSSLKPGTYYIRLQPLPPDLSMIQLDTRWARFEIPKMDRSNRVSTASSSATP